MVDSALNLRALYRSDVSGITSDDGVEALARDSWNSGSSLVFWSLHFGFGETKSSRHCGMVAGGGFRRAAGPVGVLIDCV